MAQYNFKGDIGNTSQRQLEFIHNVIKEMNFENSKVTFEPVGKPGDNYIASVKRIIIEDEHENLRLIAKIAPTSEVQRRVMNSSNLFNNEHVMYTEILPKLVKLQKDAKVPVDQQLKYAKCYGSLTEPWNEVILLEDLEVSDFKILDRFKPLSNIYIKSVLKNFAALHSLSYVLKQKEPDTYEQLKKKLIDMRSYHPVELKAIFQKIDNDVVSILEDPDHINIAKDKVAASLRAIEEIAATELDSKYSVILQGDSWTNNIMFRFEENILSESIMIDYQLSQNGHPASDLMYLIFICTDYESRKKHFYEWIDYYHSELNKALSHFHLRVEEVYPREKLNTDLKHHAASAFGQAICLSSLLVRKSDDAAKVMKAMNTDTMNEEGTHMGVSQLDLDTNTLFRNKVIGIINSFIDFEFM